MELIRLFLVTFVLFLDLQAGETGYEIAKIIITGNLEFPLCVISRNEGQGSNLLVCSFILRITLKFTFQYIISQIAVMDAQPSNKKQI